MEEPTLVFRLCRPNAFHCSACDGEFDTEGWATDVIEAFRYHVRRHHSQPDIAQKPRSRTSSSNLRAGETPE